MYLPYISLHLPIPPLYLAYTSPVSRLYLACISQAARDGGDRGGGAAARVWRRAARRRAPRTRQAAGPNPHPNPNPNPNPKPNPNSNSNPNPNPNVLAKLQAELEAADPTDLLPRVREVLEAVRQGHALLHALRTALALPAAASMHECAAAA